jgi:hypothetical protein
MVRRRIAKSQWVGVRGAGEPVSTLALYPRGSVEAVGGGSASPGGRGTGVTSKLRGSVAAVAGKSAPQSHQRCTQKHMAAKFP